MQRTGASNMTYKIGVYGSNVSEGERAEALGEELGRMLARYHCIVVTGACSGMPYIVAHEAARYGAEVWGFSPELNAEAQKRAYPNDDITIYTRLVYVPQNYKELFMTNAASEALDWAGRLKYRNVISTINSDAGIIISGGWGTLNEFTNLIYDGKPIGVLTGTGGLADELPTLYPKLRKRSPSVVLFEHDPERLIAELIIMLQKKNYR
jgi:predicted Rossmann-fold nucleotide-binding protein